MVIIAQVSLDFCWLPADNLMRMVMGLGLLGGVIKVDQACGSMRQ